MLRLRFDRCGQLEDGVGVSAVDGMQGVEGQASGRHRAGLVERHDAHAGQPLEVNAALDEHTLPRRPGERRHDRDRRRDDERARAGHDQQHERAIEPHLEWLAEREDRHDRHSERQDHHRRRVPGREAIDELLQRRPLGLRGLDEVHDAGERGIGAASRHRDGQRAVAVDGAREDFVTLELFDRQRLAGDRRLVHVRAAGPDDAVERDLFSRLDDHQRARVDLLDVDVPLAAIVANEHFGRREVEQPANRLPGAIEALRFEPLRRREQRHDHRRLLELADRDRADHGDDHQHVDVERTSLDRLPRAPGREHRSNDGGGDEDRRAPPGERGEPADAARRRDQRRGDAGEPAANARAGRRRLVLAVRAADAIVVSHELPSDGG